MGELASNFLKSVKVEFFLKPCMLAVQISHDIRVPLHRCNVCLLVDLEGFFLVEIADL